MFTEFCIVFAYVSVLGRGKWHCSKRSQNRLNGLSAICLKKVWNISETGQWMYTRLSLCFSTSRKMLRNHLKSGSRNSKLSWQTYLLVYTFHHNRPLKCYDELNSVSCSVNNILHPLSLISYSWEEVVKTFVKQIWNCH